MSSAASNTLRITGEDIELLARTVFAESDDQPFAGKLAVAYAVKNRAAIGAAYLARHGRMHPEFGDGRIGLACIRPYQFSCWNTEDAVRPRMLLTAMDDDHMQMAHAAALAAIRGTSPNPIGNCTHYYNPKRVAHPPNFALDPHGKLKPSDVVIGDHHFYAHVA